MADNPETYSKRVARLRRILPAVAVVAGLGLLFGATIDMPQMFGAKPSQGIANPLARLAISKPIFEGSLSDDGRTYRMTAKSGVQTLDNRMQLETVSLVVSPPAKAHATHSGGFTLQAERGEMDVPNGQAEFSGGVRMADTYGAVLTAPKMTADLAKGIVSAPQNIHMQSPSGSVKASSLTANTATQVYVFEKAHVRLMPNSEPAK